VTQILVVEDDEAIRHMEERILSSAGYEVTLAEDIVNARQRLAQMSHVDAVVLDVMMPGASGLDFARELRKEHSTQSLPVIMVTARSEADAMRQGFDAGATHYLAKPFSKSKLLEIVALALGSAPALVGEEPAADPLQATDKAASESEPSEPVKP